MTRGLGYKNDTKVLFVIFSTKYQFSSHLIGS